MIELMTALLQLCFKNVVHPKYLTVGRHCLTLTARVDSSTVFAFRICGVLHQYTHCCLCVCVCVMVNWIHLAGCHKYGSEQVDSAKGETFFGWRIDYWPSRDLPASSSQWTQEIRRFQDRNYGVSFVEYCHVYFTYRRKLVFFVILILNVFTGWGSHVSWSVYWTGYGLDGRDAAVRFPEGAWVLSKTPRPHLGPPQPPI